MLLKWKENILQKYDEMRDCSAVWVKSCKLQELQSTGCKFKTGCQATSSSTERSHDPTSWVQCMTVEKYNNVYRTSQVYLYVHPFLTKYT